jgi:cobalt-zinc-cadmium efflux system outer membrane protein
VKTFQRSDECGRCPKRGQCPHRRHVPRMTRRLTALAATALLAIAARPDGSHASDAVDVLHLSDVLAEARTHNPSLAVARERARAAAAMPSRVSAYDDPTVSWEAWNTPNSFAIDRADNNIIRLSQRIPFPGKRTLAGTIAAHDADAAARAVDTAALEVTTAVTRAYYDLWQAHQNQDIYARDRALVERLARATADRYAAGAATQPDVLRAHVELTHLQSKVTTEALALESARAELNALLSRAPEDPLGRPEDPAPPRLTADPTALVAHALASRPELGAQRAVVAREDDAVRLARLDYLPDFEASAGRFVNHDAPDGFGAMLSLSIPLAYKAKYDAALAEARARRAEAEAELRRLEDAVRREVRQAYLRVRTAVEQHELYRNLHLPQAEQTLAATENAYATNQVDFLSLLDSVRTIESTHLEHVRAAADFERAYADLERAVGVELARNDAATASDAASDHDQGAER